MRALVTQEWAITRIFAAKTEKRKTWEMRGSWTSIRGTVGLIESGSGQVVGVCDVASCEGPLSQCVYRKNAAKVGLRPSEAKLGYYRYTYAWVLANPKRLKKPVPYKHPSGAIIWVRLRGAVEREIRNQLLKQHHKFSDNFLEC